MKIALFLISTIVIAACNKYKPDPLEGELSYLVGTWGWDSTFHKYNWCTGGSVIEETIYPSEYGNNFSLVFDKEGFVSFYANDSLLYMRGVTVHHFEEKSAEVNYVVLHLDGDSEDIMSGDGTSLSTIFTHFPFDANDPGCEDYDNYFSKQ